MDAGDSFTVPNTQQRGCAINAAKRLGHQVTTSKVSGEGWRIWLVTKAGTMIRPEGQ